MIDAYLLFSILLITIGLFVWGYWRYDVVALFSLTSLVLLGIIPSPQAFLGFSNPAVITVASVMVITSAISQTGVIEKLVKVMSPYTTNNTLHIGILCFVTALLSAFMNNVGALALMMPIAIQTAVNAKLSPSRVLMPLSFSSVLGGLTTKIGTPPNLLLSSYKAQITGTSFNMFDFAPVGVAVATVGIVFISLVGWHLLPERRKATKQTDELYSIQDYISEIIIPPQSPAASLKLSQFEALIDEDFTVLGLIRGRKKRLVLSPNETLQANDVLIIEASHKDLHQLILIGQLELVGGEIISPESLRGDDISIIEAVVTPGSRIEGRSWQRMRIRSRLRINLLAIARSGKRIKNRLNHVNLNAGDVVLLQGFAETIQENIINLGLVPLAERKIDVGFRRRALYPLTLFLIAIALSAAELVSISIAFVAVIIIMAVFNIFPMRLAYKSIDWSIIIMLAALIPIGSALQTTGAAQLITNGVFSVSGAHSPILIITLLMVITMTLSDVMNNAATAVVMAPIASNLAQTLNMSVDPFLMSVAVGASCSFLTPISHQNNTLVMGPGAYQFQDYFKLGIPVELLALFIGVPSIYWFWL